MTNYEELLKKEEQTLQTAREIQRLLNDVNSGYSQALDALGSLKGEIEGKLEDFNNKKQTLEQNMVSSSEALKLFYQKVDEITPKIEEIKTIYASIGETKGEIDTIYESILQIEQSVKETKKLIDKAAEALDLPSFIEEATAKRDEILSGLTSDINTLLEQQKAIYRDILNQLNSAAENAIDEISNAGVQMNSIKDGAIAAVNEAKSNASSEITSLKETSLQAIQELKDQSTQAIEQQKNSSVQAVEDAEEHAIMEINKLVPTEPELIDAYTLKTISQIAASQLFSEVKQQVKVNKFWIPEEYGEFFIKLYNTYSSYWLSSIPAGTPYSLGVGDFCSIGLITYLIKHGNEVFGKSNKTSVSKTFDTPIKKIRSSSGASYILLENGDVYAVGYINGILTSSIQLIYSDAIDLETNDNWSCIVFRTHILLSTGQTSSFSRIEEALGDGSVIMPIPPYYGFIIKTADNRIYSPYNKKFVAGFKSVGIGYNNSISIELQNGNIGIVDTNGGLVDAKLSFSSHSETLWAFSIVDEKIIGGDFGSPNFSSINADNVKDILFGSNCIRLIKKPTDPIGIETTATIGV